MLHSTEGVRALDMLCTCTHQAEILQKKKGNRV